MLALSFETIASDAGTETIPTVARWISTVRAGRRRAQELTGRAMAPPKG